MIIKINNFNKIINHYGKNLYLFNVFDTTLITHKKIFDVFHEKALKLSFSKNKYNETEIKYLTNIFIEEYLLKHKLKYTCLKELEKIRKNKDIYGYDIKFISNIGIDFNQSTKKYIDNILNDKVIYYKNIIELINSIIEKKEYEKIIIIDSEYSNLQKIQSIDYRNKKCYNFKCDEYIIEYAKK